MAIPAVTAPPAPILMMRPAEDRFSSGREIYVMVAFVSKFITCIFENVEMLPLSTGSQAKAARDIHQNIDAIMRRYHAGDRIGGGLCIGQIDPADIERAGDVLLCTRGEIDARNFIACSGERLGNSLTQNTKATSHDD